jgi:sec-independent protein translocase protein TatA
MGNLGPTEIILILLVLVLLFGAKKLPELARGSGRALRIFKAETKGLMDDDDATKTDEQRAIEAQRLADSTHYTPSVTQAPAPTQPTVHPVTRPVTQPTFEQQPRSESDR